MPKRTINLRFTPAGNVEWQNTLVTPDAANDAVSLNVDFDTRTGAWTLPGDIPTPPPEPEPVEPTVPGDRPAQALSLRMVLINDSDLPKATLQLWRDVYQKVIDDAFAYDHEHVDLRIGSSLEDFDPAVETPHFFTNGIDVAGAAGYHSLVVNAGGDLDGIAFTDVDSPDPDETTGHEIFEWAANVTTSGFQGFQTTFYSGLKLCK